MCWFGAGCGSGAFHSLSYALLEAIHTGCTTIIDHHASPSCTDGSLDVSGWFRAAGLSGCLCYEIARDRNIPADGVAENERFIKKTRAGDGQITALFGLHAQMTLGDATLEATALNLRGDRRRGAHPRGGRSFGRNGLPGETRHADYSAVAMFGLTGRSRCSSTGFI